MALVFSQIFRKDYRSEDLTYFTSAKLIKNSLKLKKLNFYFLQTPFKYCSLHTFINATVLTPKGSLKMVRILKRMAKHGDPAGAAIRF